MEMGTHRLEVGGMPDALQTALIRDGRGRLINGLMIQSDDGFEPLTATQLNGLYDLMVMNTFVTHLEPLRARFPEDHRANRGIDSLAHTINYLCGAIIGTVPPSQLKRLRRMLAEVTYTVGVKCPATKDKSFHDYGVIMSWAEWDTIMSHLLDGCALCDRDEKSERGCPLKKILDSMPSDVPVHRDGRHRCQYRALV